MGLVQSRGGRAEMESTVIQDGKHPYMAQNTQKGIDINRKGINCFLCPLC